MNNKVWESVDILQLCFNNYVWILWKKTYKKYILKYEDITKEQFWSLAQYYKIVYSSNFISIEDYFNNKKSKKIWNKKNKKAKKLKRKKQKEDNILKYREYIVSKERRRKRKLFFWRVNNICECCNIQFKNSELNLHHHTYNRLWNEKDSDLAVVCLTCHKDIHFFRWKKLRLDFKILKNSFKRVRKKYIIS